MKIFTLFGTMIKLRQFWTIRHTQTIDIAEKAIEFVTTGTEIYHGNLPDGAKEHC
jgi:hypothetical protein